MNILNFTLFKKNISDQSHLINKSLENKNLYYITDGNNKQIYLKFNNVRLPFNFQLYKQKLYMNAELYPSEANYDDNLSLINKFEDCIKENMRDVLKKEYCSVIKHRERSEHLKFMLKRDSKDIILIADEDLDIKKMTEYHKLGIRYDIVVKPEILWETNDTYGVIFYIYSIRKSI